MKFDHSKLDALMRERNMTTAELANAAGIKYDGLRKLQKRRRGEPLGSTLLKIAGVLNVQPYELYRKASGEAGAR